MKRRLPIAPGKSFRPVLHTKSKIRPEIRTAASVYSLAGLSLGQLPPKEFVGELRGLVESAKGGPYSTIGKYIDVGAPRMGTPPVPSAATGQRALVNPAQQAKDAGRFGDTELVHVNKDELDEMKSQWGEPTVNPQTGLPEYFLSGLRKKAKKLWKKVKKHAIPKELRQVADFELRNLQHMWKQVKRNPMSLVLGAATPFGAKLWSGVTGRRFEPIVNMYGGPTKASYDYAKSKGVDIGPGRTIHDIGEVVASFFGAKGAMGGLGKLAKGAGPAVKSLIPGRGATGAVETAGQASSVAGYSAAAPAVMGQSGYSAAAAAAPAAAAAGTTTAAAGGLGGFWKGLSFADKLVIAKMGVDVLGGLMAPKEEDLLEKARTWQGAFYGRTAEEAATAGAQPPPVGPNAAPTVARSLITSPAQSPPAGPTAGPPPSRALVAGRQPAPTQPPAEQKRLPELQPLRETDEIFSSRAPGVRYVA